MRWATGIAFATVTFRGLPTLQIARGSGRYSLTAAFGIATRAVAARPRRRGIDSSGSTSLRRTYDATSEYKVNCGDLVSAWLSSGNASVRTVRVSDDFVELWSRCHDAVWMCRRRRSVGRGM